jgi:Protein of unknown function (DUF1059)
LKSSFVEDNTSKITTCRDAGFDCAAVIKGDTEDELLQMNMPRVNIISNQKI